MADKRRTGGIPLAIQIPTGLNMGNQASWQCVSYDLRTLIGHATQKFNLEAIYLFGSRRHKTRSLRSDIDIFFEASAYIKPSDLRLFIETECRALDIFLLSNGRAQSAINESFIEFPDNGSVLRATSAVCLWTSVAGHSSNNEVDWVQAYASHVSFEQTVMPNLVFAEPYDRLVERLEQEGLPTDPIIGESEEEIALRLIQVAEEVAKFSTEDFRQGSARNSFVVLPKSEYDFQDIFWIAIKPWIRRLNREQTEVIFDGQKKVSDFSLMQSRFIIEMKFAKDKDQARAIVKTLEGLASFYRENANVRYLLFIIYAQRGSEINKRDWEARFSSSGGCPRVYVRVIEID